MPLVFGMCMKGLYSFLDRSRCMMDLVLTLSTIMSMSVKMREQYVGFGVSGVWFI